VTKTACIGPVEKKFALDF